MRVLFKNVGNGGWFDVLINGAAYARLFRQVGETHNEVFNTFKNEV